MIPRVHIMYSCCYHAKLGSIQEFLNTTIDECGQNPYPRWHTGGYII